MDGRYRILIGKRSINRTLSTQAGYEILGGPESWDGFRYCGNNALKSASVMAWGRFSKRNRRYQYGSRSFALAVSIRL